VKGQKHLSRDQRLTNQNNNLLKMASSSGKRPAARMGRANGSKPAANRKKFTRDWG
jgi:hypothetical protein